MISDILNRKFVFFDGATGTMLQKCGLLPGERTDAMNIRLPDAVESVQRLYVDAGSDLICTNTFGANRKTLSHSPYTPQEVIPAAIAIARRACGDKATPVYDIGPTGEFMEPAGDMTYDEAYDLFTEQVIEAEKAGAECFVIETMTDLQELRAALCAVKHNSSLPVIAMMTFTHSGRTLTGCTPESFAVTAEAIGADVIGMNCSLVPEELLPVAKKLAYATSLPICIKPNAGLPKGVDAVYEITPESFAEQMTAFASLGVKIVGGCCGTNPDFIRALRAKFENLEPTPRFYDSRRRICSLSVTKYADELSAAAIPELSFDNSADEPEYIEKDGVAYTALPTGITDDEAFEYVGLVQAETPFPIVLVTEDGSGLEGALKGIAGCAAVHAVSGDVSDTASRYGAFVI
ncbi:MAG: homocysteine S-methyltransferase family protein [Oscillospiraceae bacterium]|nr:homocysteine S-methyltransferase family protein [Oscillospiraceae bacterium]